MAENATTYWMPEVYIPEPKAITIKALFYGPPGVGKSTLAATASTVEGMYPVLYINAESGIMSISEDWEGRIDTQNLRITDYQNIQWLGKMFEYLAFEQHPYKTVVLDSMSELATRVVKQWKDKYVPKTAEGFAQSEDAEKRMQLKIYDKATEQLRTISRQFRDLPIHLIMVSHDKQTDENGLIVTSPDLTPKFTTSLIGYMDIVGYLTTREVVKEGDDKEKVKEVQRVLTCTPTPRRKAKDRSPGQKLAGLIFDPTMGKIMDLLTGEV